MEIELSSILISLALFGFIAAFIIYDQTKKKQHKAERTVIDKAQTKGLSLDEYDVQPEAWGIGLDSKSHRLIYLSLNGEKKEEVINLRKVKKCEYMSSYESNGQPAPALRLHFTNSSGPEELSFKKGSSKKEDHDAQARKWQALIDKEVA